MLESFWIYDVSVESERHSCSSITRLFLRLLFSQLRALFVRFAATSSKGLFLNSLHCFQGHNICQRYPSLNVELVLMITRLVESKSMSHSLFHRIWFAVPDQDSRKSFLLKGNSSLGVPLLTAVARWFAEWMGSGSIGICSFQSNIGGTVRARFRISMSYFCWMTTVFTYGTYEFVFCLYPM